jgi:hypothetical protein
MEQEKINYDEIMALDFTEEISEDSSYYAEHGYQYAIITKDLTKKIYLDWTKETKLCEMVRLDKAKCGNIKARMPIMNLDHLKDMINFFSNEKELMPTYSHIA